MILDQKIIDAKDFCDAMNLDIRFNFIPLRKAGLLMQQVEDANAEVFQGIQIIHFDLTTQYHTDSYGAIQCGLMQLYFVSKSETNALNIQNQAMRLMLPSDFGFDRCSNNFDLNNSGLIIYDIFPEGGKLPQIAEPWGTGWWAVLPRMEFAARFKIEI
jgi:hypothetical protein